MTQFLFCFDKIQWPVNIIITENCVTKYNRVSLEFFIQLRSNKFVFQFPKRNIECLFLKMFAFILRLKRVAWTLQDIRYSLKRMGKWITSYSALSLPGEITDHLQILIYLKTNAPVNHFSLEKFTYSGNQNSTNLFLKHNIPCTCLMNCETYSCLDMR